MLEAVQRSLDCVQVEQAGAETDQRFPSRAVDLERLTKGVGGRFGVSQLVETHTQIEMRGGMVRLRFDGGGVGADRRFKPLPLELGPPFGDMGRGAGACRDRLR